jgi:hypothetical protein
MRLHYCPNLQCYLSIATLARGRTHARARDTRTHAMQYIRRWTFNYIIQFATNSALLFFK